MTTTPSTVTVFDYAIPVFDYLTAWEMERVELLAAQQPESATRHDLATLAVFAKSRLGVDLDIEKLMQRPIKDDELARAVEALVDPFFKTQLERVRRRLSRAARYATPEEKAKRIAELTAELESLKSGDGTPS